MVYEDEEGEHREEPACPRCISRFAWKAEQKEVIGDVLRLHHMWEEYEMTIWHKLEAQYGSSDYMPMREIQAVLDAMESCKGPYGLSFDQMRSIRGSIHIALAASALSEEQGAKACGVLRLLDVFSAHLHNCHRDQEGMRIDHEVLESLRKPKYIGCFSFEKALRWAPEFAGKSFDEIEHLLGKKVDGLLDDLKVDLVQAHGGRTGRLSVLATGIWNAIEIVESKADDWLRLVKDATECVYLLHVPREVHEQIFLIDELFALGAWNHDADLLSLGGEQLYEAIDRIRSLIDWDECEQLKAWMDQADQSPRSGQVRVSGGADRAELSPEQGDAASRRDVGKTKDQEVGTS
jgi:hypothetical protein